MGIQIASIQWPNQLTKLVFLKMLSRPVKQAPGEVERYEFDMGGTDFGQFSREELEVQLQEYLDFVVEDIGEVFAVAESNPLPETRSVDVKLEVEFCRMLLGQVDVGFLAGLALTQITKLESCQFLDQGNN